MSRTGATKDPPDSKDEQVRIALSVMALALAQATSAFNRLATAVGADPALLSTDAGGVHDVGHEQPDASGPPAAGR